jgi:hypothetical protein
MLSRTKKGTGAGGSEQQKSTTSISDRGSSSGASKVQNPQQSSPQHSISSVITTVMTPSDPPTSTVSDNLDVTPGMI